MLSSIIPRVILISPIKGVLPRSIQTNSDDIVTSPKLESLKNASIIAPARLRNIIIFSKKYICLILLPRKTVTTKPSNGKNKTAIAIFIIKDSVI